MPVVSTVSLPHLAANTENKFRLFKMKIITSTKIIRTYQTSNSLQSYFWSIFPLSWRSCWSNSSNAVLQMLHHLFPFLLLLFHTVFLCFWAVALLWCISATSWLASLCLTISSSFFLLIQWTISWVVALLEAQMACDFCALSRHFQSIFRFSFLCYPFLFRPTGQSEALVPPKVLYHWKAKWVKGCTLLADAEWELIF